MAIIIDSNKASNFPNIPNPEMGVINDELVAFYNYEETPDHKSLVKVLDEYSVSWYINSMTDDCKAFHLIELNNTYLIYLTTYDHDDYRSVYGSEAGTTLSITHIAHLSNSDAVSYITDIFASDKKRSEETCN
jgi:hypothetical protein